MRINEISGCYVQTNKCIQQRTTQHIASIFCVSHKKIQVQVYNKTTNTKLKIATHVRYTTSHVDMSWIVTRTETLWLHTHYSMYIHAEYTNGKNIIWLFCPLVQKFIFIECLFDIMSAYSKSRDIVYTDRLSEMFCQSTDAFNWKKLSQNILHIC